jgi:steroid 5-alpha reductase family enzyme
MIANLIIALAASLILNLIGFYFAYKNQSDKLTDGSYSLSFIVVAITALIIAKNRNFYFITSLLMVCVWASRIGFFLVRRVIRNKKDGRFDGIRNKPRKFLQFWLGQAVTAWLLMLPVLFETKHSHQFDVLAFVGLGVWVMGLSIESLSDYQKGRFKADNANKNKWIDSGIWHYSRHPNYFGEIIIWIGVYIFCFSALSNLQRYIGLVSPAAIIILLLFVSGVPALEKSAERKWGSNPKYREYRDKTNLIIPFYTKY